MTTAQHTPPWSVVGVFDPDGDGADFAYTVGLIDAGSPAELHMWARPSDGLDPGEDWSFSTRDRQQLLNQHGRRAVDGELRPGDTWIDHLDGGFTTVCWTVGGPVESPELDTFQLDDGTPVWPLRFSIDRLQPAPGAPLPVPDPEVVAAHVRRIADAAPAREERWLAIRPRPVASDPKHGPWAPVIAELRSVLDSLAADLEVDTLVGAADVTRWMLHQLSILRGAARSVGRLDVLDSLTAVAERDAEAYAGRICWADPDIDEAFAAHMELLLRVTYSAWAVADVLGPNLLRAMTGPFDLVVDPETSTERFGEAWQRAGRPLRCADTGAMAPADLPSAWARAATVGIGAPVVPDLLPEWTDALDCRADDSSTELLAVFATLEAARAFVPDSPG